MSVPAFGYAARLRHGHGEGFWLAAAGFMLWWGSLAALCLWVPGSIDPHEAPKQALLAFVAMASAVGAFVGTRRDETRVFSWAFLPALGALGLSAAVSWAFAPDHWLGLFGVAGSVSLSLLTWFAALSACLAAGTLAVAGWRPKLAGGYAVFVFLAVFAAAQRFGWVDLSPGGPAARLFSPVGNAAGLAWLALPVGLYALAREGVGGIRSVAERWSGRLAGIAAFAWIACLDLTGIWVVWSAGYLVLLAAFLVRRSERPPLAASIVAGGAALAGIVGAFLPLPQPSLPLLASLSAGQSLETVRGAWRGGAALIGAGPGQWNAVFEAVRPVALNFGSLFAVRFDVGGAFWWTLLLQQGTLGGLAWIAFLFVVARETWVRLREDAECLPLAAAVWSGVAALFLMHPPGWGIVLLFACIGALVAGSRPASPAVRRFIWMKAGGLALLVACLLPFAGARLLADRDLAAAAQAKGADERERFAQAAMRRVPAGSEYAQAAIQADAARLGGRLANEAEDPLRLQQDLGQAIERAKAATARWPGDPELWFAQGTLYAVIAPAVQGADQFAIQAYQNGLAFAPRRPEFAFGIAQIFMRRADGLAKEAAGAKGAQARTVSEARLEQLRLAAQWLRRALEQKPDDRSLRYAYAVTLARSGELTQALALFAQLTQEEPARGDLVLEYAVLLVESGQRESGYRLVEGIGSGDPLFLPSRRLLASWYEADHRWDEAVAALRLLPLAEQQAPAMRERLRQLQSKGGSAGSLRR